MSDDVIDVDAHVEALDAEGSEGGELSGPVDYYAVPEGIVQHQFPPIETRFQHPVIPMEARVILASGDEERAYQPVFEVVQARFPIRAARLRDLYHRVQRGRERFLERQQREELLRVALNVHANFINQQVAQDLQKQREAYERQRPVLAETIQRLEAEQAVTEAPYREELSGREQALAHARLQRAEERHAALSAAERAVDQAEAVSIGRHQPAIDTAAARHDGIRLETALRLQAEVEDVVLEARSLEAQLLAEVAEREGELHQAHQAAAAHRAEREAALHDARKTVADATAVVGLLPDEARSDPRERLRTLMKDEAVTAGDEAQYPEEGKHRWTGWLKSVPLLFATAACGSIFGLSLALLTGILRSFGSITAQPEKAALVCVLGGGIFFLIGELVQRALTLASEAREAEDRRGHYSFWAAIGVIVLVAAIEITVERYGMVEAAIKNSPEYALGGHGSIGPLEGPAGWCIAAVVALPFMLYHAFHGWMDTRYRTAQRRRLGRVARERQERVDGEAFRSFVAAVHHVERAEGHVAATPEAHVFPEVVHATRRLQEVERRRQEHPLLVRAAQLEAEVERRLQSDPQVQHAGSLLQAAREALAQDPELQAARRRLEREKTVPEHSPEIVELEHLLARARERFDRDPAVVAANIRVRQAQLALNRLEEGYAADRVRIDKQRKALRHAPDKWMRARIQDAREEWQAAQLIFDGELACVMRLLECPRYLLWWEHLRLYSTGDGFSPATVRKQVVPAGVAGGRGRAVRSVGIAAGATAIILGITRFLFR